MNVDPKVKHYQNNREKILNRERDRYSNNREKILFQSRQRRLKFPERTLFTLAKARAKKKQVPFNIEVSDIQIPELCPLLGIPLRMSKGQSTDNSPSLDRLIPELGYVKDNVWVISHRANLLKSSASISELELILINLKKRLQKNDE